MRRFLTTLGLLSTFILLVAPAGALERTAVPLTDARTNDGWAAGATVTVSYYNTCTGWLWIWSGWSPTDIVGMTLETPLSDGCFLMATNLYAWSGAPSGYGFTGTVSLSTADANGCPGTLIASQSLLPVSGNNVNLWGVGGFSDFVVTYQHANSPLPDPTVWSSDHPAAGPTGPAACGVCYPSTRTIHSFYYGNATTALCPGSTLDDGVCDAEWLLWAASYQCVVSVEENSWGSVKNLYR